MIIVVFFYLQRELTDGESLAVSGATLSLSRLCSPDPATDGALRFTSFYTKTLVGVAVFPTLSNHVYHPATQTEQNTRSTFSMKIVYYFIVSS